MKPKYSMLPLSNSQVIAAEREAINQGYIRNTIEVHDKFVNLPNEDWKNFIAEGMILDIIDLGSHLEAMGSDEHGHKFSLGKIMQQEEKYRHGIIISPKVQNKRLHMFQTIFLHSGENIPSFKVGSLDLRTRAGKSKFEKRIDRLEKTGKELDEAGKSFMPLTFAIILIVVLLYMCL